MSKSGVKDGDAIIYCPHTTAGITINENADPSVTHDILLTLEELIPHLRAGIGTAKAIRMLTAKARLSDAAKQF